ncbi:M56 family metallopeptidase [Mucilaginibacter sp. FT3.2]|uniref:M56 family metallopeptidase n=1 Tax=Mucilaginibacter sp. FT3.2 TaxID=2723090 RepID=UPI00161262C0|nr:M56 family metallopeptidase [Mucilaginibacter sp. FT3.2]MBB6232163.1 TonB family protein [Mucilaginibacter sp. FT3.2]
MIWWQYLLLVNIYLVLFYAFYVVLLRKETFFQLNRIYLVTASLLSFFIPVIQADWVQNLFITQQVKYTIYNIPVIEYHFKPIEESHINMGQLFVVLYLGGILVLSAKLTWQLFKLKKLISMPKAAVPYSFFKTVKLDENNPDNAVIEAHEQVHAQQWHSADVLFIEMVMIINWFNPVVYLYRFAIKHIHEYIADRQAVQAGTSKADYALLLLRQTFNAPAHQLVNPFFNHSLLKKRIIMLQKNKSQRISLIKYGLSAPLFILMLILSSATINNSKTITAINDKAQEIFITPAAQVNLSTILPDDKDPSIATKKRVEQDTSKVFTSVEQLPVFPGGIDAFGRFLSANTRYPKDAREKNIQGKVICKFVVEEDGSLSDIQTVKSVSPDIDAEAIRVLNLSPKWNPGVQNGLKVRTQYAVPINFTLAGDGNKPTEPAQTITDDNVYSSVEELPGFPGGVEALGKFLSANIKYPANAREKGIEGRVICTFVIETDGSLSNIKISRGVSPDLDEEALRVLKLSPNWTPGKQGDKKVRVQYSIPISFTLADEKKPLKATENKSGAVISLTSKFPSYAGVEIPRDTAIKGHPVGKYQYSSILNQANPPLYVLNNKIASEAVIKQLDVNTIESIAVLKDKNATALWGDKGINGVVMVTTKK